MVVIHIFKKFDGDRLKLQLKDCKFTFDIVSLWNNTSQQNMKVSWHLTEKGNTDFHTLLFVTSLWNNVKIELTFGQI